MNHTDFDLLVDVQLGRFQCPEFATCRDVPITNILPRPLQMIILTYLRVSSDDPRLCCESPPRRSMDRANHSIGNQATYRGNFATGTQAACLVS